MLKNQWFWAIIKECYKIPYRYLKGIMNKMVQISNVTNSEKEAKAGYNKLSKWYDTLCR